MDILQNNKPGATLQNWINKIYWVESFLLVYIFTLPFVSAFAFTGTISLPLIFAVVLFLLTIIQITRLQELPVDFIGFDVVLLGLLIFLIVFSYSINGWGNPKSLNHTIAYLSTFLLFYIGIKFTLFNSNQPEKLFERVLKYITYATCLSALFANLEFVSANIVGINLNDYIPRAVEGEEYYDPKVIGLFIRARGFATESGHFTLMMELFSPLAVYYMFFSGFCNWVMGGKVIFTILFFFSFIFAASSASFIILPTAFLFSLLVYNKKVFAYLKKSPKKIIFSASAIAIAVVIFNYLFSLNALILLSISDKLDSNSFDDRQERIDFFYDKFFRFDPITQLCGAGPAGFSNLGFDDSKSILSLYYKIPFELGLIGIFIVCLFILYVFINVLQIKSKAGFFLMISFVSGVIHYYFISNYWYPWFWFIAAFAVFYNKKFPHG